MINKFTQKAQSALSAALRAAEELGHSYIGTEHLLLGLLEEKDSIASRILSARGAKPESLRSLIAERMGVGTKCEVCSSDMTPRLHILIENAAREAERGGVRYVGTEHLLCALINRRDCVAVRILEASGVLLGDLRADLAAYLGNAPYKRSESSAEKHDRQKASVLLSYGRDLTEAARVGRTDPVLCRDLQTERIIRILCRRSKNNPCLIGEPGVGKTAVVEGLAERIATGRVPPELAQAKLITLDISAMIAGAKFRGEFEDRVKSVIEEVRRDPNIILFIDEMHVMVGAGAAEGAIDASNILKPSLSRGEIRIIGATTPAEYRAHIEKDSALERRFQPVILDEPDESEAIAILRGLRSRYEEHHGVSISDEAIESAVRLSARYIRDRFLPDKAIDLMDEAAAKLKLRAHSSCENGSEHMLLDSIERRREEAVKRGDMLLAAELSAEERALSHTSSVAILESAPPAPLLTADEVAALISEQTGIPCGRLTMSEDRRLSRLESQLNERVIGQEAAVSAVVNAVRRGRSGLGAPERPTGSFLLLGSSGVGKTELCRALADSLFESRDALIKLDMSEYMEKQSVARLIGAPPGYVGYDSGGLLTDRVRRHPYSVIVFDEIEKAHPDVLHLLLQILEDGRLTDSTGRKADFSSSVIMMTSNLLSSEDSGGRILGFCQSSCAGERDLRSDPTLLRHFSPELLGRIDEIIRFAPLDVGKLERIAYRMLKDLCARAQGTGITLRTDAELPALLARTCATEHKGLGARPLRGEIRRLIEDPLAELMTSAHRHGSGIFRVLADNGQVRVIYEDAGSDAPCEKTDKSLT